MFAPIPRATSTWRRASTTTSSTAVELGIPSIWINRLGEPRGPTPQRTLPSLHGLADALDEIVPGSR